MDIVITVFESRKNPIGTVEKTTVEEFFGRLKDFIVTDESTEEYWAMTNEQRTEVKDVGGYVAGEFDHGRRSKLLLKNRYIVTIDADYATDHDVADFKRDHKDVKFFAHRTHSSTEEHPRLRWLFPLKRPVTANEYRALVGVMKHWVNADSLDETTDQPERLMFWPSIPWDGVDDWWEGGEEFADPDELLEGADIEPDYTAPEPVKNKPEKPSEESDTIEEGSRNATLFSKLAAMRELGLNKEDLEVNAELLNRKCNPPLPDSELKLLVGSVMRYKKGDLVPFDFRDPHKDFADLGKWGEKKRKGLKVEKFVDLLNADLEPINYVVPGIVTVGLGSVIAPPKYRKSWLCLDLGIAVSSGTKFMNDFDTNKTGVLYYALEDGYNRLRDRSRSVIDGRNDLDLSGWNFVMKTETNLDTGFIEELDEALSEHPDVKLVIIDTFQRIRGMPRKGESAYSYDYREANMLADYAKGKKISILLVHHTRKGLSNDDPLSNASGSNGFIAALDYAIILTRSRRKDSLTTMDITGRDVREKTYVLKFNDNSCRWENLGEEKDVKEDGVLTEYNNDPIVKTVRYYLDMAEDTSEEEEDEVVWRVSATDLMNAITAFTGESGFDSAAALGRKVKALTEPFKTYDGITYTYDRTNKGRLHTFRRLRV